MSEPHKPVGAIFDAAIELPTERRAAYLDTACGGDDALRQRVETLLRAHELVGTFMGRPAVTSQRDTQPAMPTQKPGDRIGRYKLLEQIGEGGCGVVYMAEQEEPVRRLVALKVIKLGMDTKNVIARFEAERQALALMDYPNIAKVLDAGATDTGRPYFVMELVRGIKITDYCDDNKLSMVARLELFVQVCQAIQHAHQKGIIHRDIKPSNILVADHDGVPVPKIIDFGIAKATTDQRLTDKTLFTAFEQFIGTPAYMSPEQARLSGLDIDTRSDIYSLGVLLYELLTGKTPFEASRLLEAGLDEIRRIIRDEEPLRPSTRLQALDAAEQTTVAGHRQSVPPKLFGIIRGDLDWIVMKALEKDRARRYETANSFAADIQRHLNNEPVTASPPGNLYRFQKLVRRNQLAFIAASAVSAALIIGLGVATWMYLRERTAHQEAVAAGIQESRLREEAQAAKGQETSLRVKAQAMELAERHKAYALDMNVAFRAWDQGDIDRVTRLLAEYHPKPGEEDMRGFEWYYLWRLCHSDQLTLEGHEGFVRGVAFSPDGTLLATAGDDGTARLWDSQTGKQLHLLSGPPGGVAAPVFSPDGKILATGGQDMMVKLWDVSTGKELASLSGHKLAVTALAFSRDGKWLVSASGALADGTGNPYTKFVTADHLAAEIKIWDVATRKEIRTLLGHQRGILSLAISPDAQTIATASADGTVKLWTDALGNLRTNQLTGFKGPMMAVAISPDGQSVAVGGGNPYQMGNVLKIFDLATLQERMSFKGHEGPVFAVTFSPDGKTLASAGMDQIVRIWDCTSGEERGSIRGHQASIWSLAFDPSGRRLATASWDGTAKVWDAQGSQSSTMYNSIGAYSSCFSPDGKYLIAANNGLKIIEPGTDKVPVTVSNYALLDPLVSISPDGKILASGGDTNNLMLWEVGTWRPLADWRDNWDALFGLTFSPDGRIIACQDPKSVRLIEVTDHRQMAKVEAVDSRSPVFFSPDGQTLITMNVRTHELIYSDVKTGRVKQRFPGIGWCLAQSRDGRWLATTVGNEVEMRDAQTMEVKWHSSGHAAWVYTASFSPDGKTLATGCWEGTCKLWNTASGQEMFSYRAPGVVWSANFSPEGDRLAVGTGSAAQGELALLRAATPAEVSAFETPPRIDTQPAGAAAPQGGGVTLEAAASGKLPLTLQWRRADTDLPGQTNRSLKVASLSTATTGPYSVVARNLYGSVTSSVALVTIQPVREGPVVEANGRDKLPLSFFTSAGGDKKGPIIKHASVMPGAGRNGGVAWAMTADGSGFTNSMDQSWSHFRSDMHLKANATSGIDTTNLNLYRMEVTVRTDGLKQTESHGRVMAQFLAPSGSLLVISIPATFTTNYQDYSFILGSGQIDPWEIGSWNKFIGGFDQINAVGCAVSADNWIDEYDLKKESAFFIDHVRFVRLVPDSPPAPGHK